MHTKKYPAVTENDKNSRSESTFYPSQNFAKNLSISKPADRQTDRLRENTQFVEVAIDITAPLFHSGIQNQCNQKT